MGKIKGKQIESINKSQVLNLENDLANYYSKTEVDTNLLEKAEKNHTHQNLGVDSIVIGENSLVQGQNNTTYGKNSHSEGLSKNKAQTYLPNLSSSTTYDDVYNAWTSEIDSRFSLAYGANSHTEGENTVAYGVSSHSEGSGSFTKGFSAHAEGSDTRALGAYSHAEGSRTTASGTSSHSQGEGTVASGSSSFAGGENTIANVMRSTVIGVYNKQDDTGSSTSMSTSSNLFCIGNGSNTARKNAFRVTYGGSIYGASAFNSSGADYAEYFEWLDGNSLNEDRIGLFVTLSGDKIKKANKGDFILGVISHNASLIGNSFDDNWQGMHVKDKFGRYETEEFIEYTPDGRQYNITGYKLNSEYNSTLQYNARSERNEWDIVGLLGQLVVIDDGTCQVDGYCNVGNDGIATMSDNGYRVMKRIDDSTILILFR